MKLYLIRESGKPVPLDQIENYEKRYKDIYDDVFSDFVSQDQMVEKRKEAEERIEILQKECEMIKEIEMPTSKKRLVALLEEYGVVELNLGDSKKVFGLIKDL